MRLLPVSEDYGLLQLAAREELPARERSSCSVRSWRRHRRLLSRDEALHRLYRQNNGRAVIYVDADACPVREEAIRVAERHGIAVWLVSNGGIRPPGHPLVKVVVVQEGADAADRWIAERIGPGDLCVTADIPLAARCLAAGGRVLRPDGTALTEGNIGQALALRDLAADLRAADPFRRGGGRPFTKADRSRFLEALEREVRAIAAARF